MFVSNGRKQKLNCAYVCVLNYKGGVIGFGFSEEICY